jgi:hypothetical protein
LVLPESQANHSASRLSAGKGKMPSHPSKLNASLLRTPALATAGEMPAFFSRLLRRAGTACRFHAPLDAAGQPITFRVIPMNQAAKSETLP